MHVGDVSELQRRYAVRRVVLPSSGTESFTVIGPDRRPIEIVDEYLGWLTNNERSPNTVEAYSHDLRAFWTFLDEHGLTWDRVRVMELAEFAAWARRPAHNVVVMSDAAARLSPRTVNRMLTGVVGFYELQARRGSTLAKDLIVQTRRRQVATQPHLDSTTRSAQDPFRRPIPRLTQPCRPGLTHSSSDSLRSSSAPPGRFGRTPLARPAPAPRRPSQTCPRHARPTTIGRNAGWMDLVRVM